MSRTAEAQQSTRAEQRGGTDPRTCRRPPGLLPGASVVQEQGVQGLVSSVGSGSGSAADSGPRSASAADRIMRRLERSPEMPTWTPSPSRNTTLMEPGRYCSTVTRPWWARMSPANIWTLTLVPTLGILLLAMGTLHGPAPGD